MSVHQLQELLSDLLNLMRRAEIKFPAPPPHSNFENFGFRAAQIITITTDKDPQRKFLKQMILILKRKASESASFFLEGPFVRGEYLPEFWDRLF